MIQILKAFANFNHEVQYCEGMNYLAGVLILHMNEEVLPEFYAKY
jgi:hypothetical protein